MKCMWCGIVLRRSNAKLWDDRWECKAPQACEARCSAAAKPRRSADSVRLSLENELPPAEYYNQYRLSVPKPEPRGFFSYDTHREPPNYAEPKRFHGVTARRRRMNYG